MKRVPFYVKTAVVTFWASFKENLATFYSNIWSHCYLPTYLPSCLPTYGKTFRERVVAALHQHVDDSHRVGREIRKVVVEELAPFGPFQDGEGAL